MGCTDGADNGSDHSLTEGIIGNTMFLYRAVDDREFYSIMQTERFFCLPGGVGVKYFGKNYEDTLRFADRVINKNVVAIVEVEVIQSVVVKIGDFADVDSFIFRYGTVEIWEADIGEFNSAIIRIAHKF